MGTVFTVVAYGPKSTSPRETVDQAFREVDRLDDELSHYKQESKLSVINREAYRRSVVVEPEFFRLLEDSFRYSEETCGAFDVATGALMKAWGFFRGCGRVPRPVDLARALRRVGHQHVVLDASARTVRFDRHGIELDLGAIAKGYAVDRVVALLRGAGIRQALVSSGSSTIYALGSPPGEQTWKIALRDPLRNSGVACVLRLRNLALSVSGICEKRFEWNGKTYSHLMDPLTGAPAERVLMSVVVSPSGAASDALATSFFVAGVDRSRAYLECHPNLAVILYLATQSRRASRPVVLKSRVTRFPPESVVKIEEHDSGVAKRRHDRCC